MVLLSNKSTGELSGPPSLGRRPPGLRAELLHWSLKHTPLQKTEPPQTEGTEVYVFRVEPEALGTRVALHCGASDVDPDPDWNLHMSEVQEESGTSPTSKSDPRTSATPGRATWEGGPFIPIKEPFVWTLAVRNYASRFSLEYVLP